MKFDEIAILILLVLAIGTIGFLSVSAVLNFMIRLPNHAAVSTVGLSIFQDPGCTTPLTALEWGTLAPGNSKNQSGYVRNDGNVNTTLSMVTENWIPSNATTWITCSWDREGDQLTPGQVALATFTLNISSTITDITSFNFDILLTGSA